MVHDFVYILGTGSTWDNNEIKYSLRSLKNIKHGKVFIIGECPDFIDKTRLVHIPAEDPYTNKVKNALHKIRIACTDKRISEDFVLMNDDFFFLKPTKSLKVYYRSTLTEGIQRHRQKFGYYFDAIKATRKYLQELGIEEPKNYSFHYPMVFNKTRALELLDSLDDSILLFRVLYSNINKLGGINSKDFKAHNIQDFYKLRSTDFMSTSEMVVQYQEVRKFFKTLFPNQSPYEKVATI